MKRIKRENAKTLKTRQFQRFDVSAFQPFSVGAIALVLSVTETGCVRRTITISTAPPNALVYLNDQEIGRSTATTDFLWYGDYDVIIRKEGYTTLKTHWKIKPPWYQKIPFDFFAEVLWPKHIHDHHERHFALEPAVPPTQEELIERALETRDKALDVQKPRRGDRP